MNTFNSNINKQKGAVLAVSLILLLVMTLLAVSNLQNIVLQEKMTMAVREGHISLEIAESGLVDAENYIETLALASFSDTGAGGLYSKNNGPADYFASANWVSGKYKTADTEIDGTRAIYYIEDLGVIVDAGGDMGDINMMGYGQTTGGGDIEVFKIVSRTTGKSGNSERILVTFYGKRL